MSLANLNPFIRYAGNPINLRANPFRSFCYDCRLFFVKKGTGIMEIEDTCHNLYESTLIYLPAGTQYRFLPNEADMFSLLVFDFDLVSDYAHLTDSLGTVEVQKADLSRILIYAVPKEFSMPIVGSIPKLLSPLEQCIREYLTKAPYYQESASALIKTALLELLKNATITRDREISGQITEYIHSNYQNPELTNGRIAEHFGYHPYYLSQLIKKTTGHTLHNYLLYYRLHMAKNLLVTTDWDIETISWKSGFNSVSHFIKLFRQANGITPRKYRQVHGNTIF